MIGVSLKGIWSQLWMRRCGWTYVTALHIAASYLDPSLKSFSFVKDGKEWRNLLEQATQAAWKNAMHLNGILCQ